MDELIQRPRFLPALLISVLAGMALMSVGAQRGVIAQFMRQQMESNPRLEQIPAEQRERIIEQSTKFSTYMFVGGAVVGPVIGLLATSGFFLLVSNILLGAKARFLQLMGIVAHAWLPNSLLGLIGIPILLAKEPDAVDMRNIVPMTNLGLLVDSTQHPKLFAMATSLDLFSFWVIGLVALGLSRLTGKSLAAVLPAIVVPWLVYVLVIKPLQA
jgi:hypothetical protein